MRILVYREDLLVEQLLLLLLGLFALLLIFREVDLEVVDLLLDGFDEPRFRVLTGLLLLVLLVQESVLGLLQLLVLLLDKGLQNRGEGAKTLR